MSKTTTVNYKNKFGLALVNLGLMAGFAGLGIKTFIPADNSQSNHMSAFGGINLSQDASQAPTNSNLSISSLIKPELVAPANSESTKLSDFLDPDLTDKALKGFNGGAVIIDDTGKIVGKGFEPFKLLEPASTVKVVTTTEFLRKHKPDKVLSSFNGKKVIKIVKSILSVSDNVLAEDVAKDVGFDLIQTNFRNYTKLPKLTLGNGSGCPGTSSGNDTHLCQGKSLTGRANRVSAYAIALASLELDKIITGYNLNLGQALTPSLENEFGSNMKAGTVHYKTGTLPSTGIKSLTGKVVTKSGKAYYFAFINEGLDLNYAENWHHAVIEYIFTGKLK